MRNTQTRILPVVYATAMATWLIWMATGCSKSTEEIASPEPSVQQTEKSDTYELAKIDDAIHAAQATADDLNARLAHVEAQIVETQQSMKAEWEARKLKKEAMKTAKANSARKEMAIAQEKRDIERRRKSEAAERKKIEQEERDLARKAETQKFVARQQAEAARHKALAEAIRIENRRQAEIRRIKTEEMVKARERQRKEHSDYNRAVRRGTIKPQ